VLLPFVLTGLLVLADIAIIVFYRRREAQDRREMARRFATQAARTRRAGGAAALARQFPRDSSDAAVSSAIRDAPPDLRRRPQLSFDRAKGDIRHAVARLLARGEDMRERPDYWGPALPMVLVASQSCERIVNAVLEREPGAPPYDLLIEALAVSRQWFDCEYGDEDGFGGACYRELIEAVVDLQVSQQGASRHDRDAWRELAGKGRFSKAFLYYANATTEAAALCELIRQRDYAACYDLAMRGEQLSGRQDVRDWFLRCKIMLCLRVGDDAAAEQVGRQIRLIRPPGLKPREDLFDALAAGETTLAEVTEPLLPLDRMQALFWEGARRVSDGDPAGTAMMQDLVELDFDKLECALAGAELGLSWADRMLATPVDAARAPRGELA